MSQTLGIGALVLAGCCFSSAVVLITALDALVIGRSKGTNKEFDDYLGKKNRPLFINASSCMSLILMVVGIVTMFL